MSQAWTERRKQVEVTDDEKKFRYFCHTKRHPNLLQVERETISTTKAYITIVIRP